MYNDFLYLNRIVAGQGKEIAPVGLGANILARLVRAILKFNQTVESRHQIKKLRVQAEGGADNYISGRKTWNGAYTWARLGFNARFDDIDVALKPKLRQDAKRTEYNGTDLQRYVNIVETLNELILFGGAEWWRENSVSFYGTFDLSPNSNSMLILRGYLRRKGIEL